MIPVHFLLNAVYVLVYTLLIDKILSNETNKQITAMFIPWWDFAGRARAEAAKVNAAAREAARKAKLEQEKKKAQDQAQAQAAKSVDNQATAAMPIAGSPGTGGLLTMNSKIVGIADVIGKVAVATSSGHVKGISVSRPSAAVSKGFQWYHRYSRVVSQLGWVIVKALVQKNNGSIKTYMKSIDELKKQIETEKANWQPKKNNKAHGHPLVVKQLQSLIERLDMLKSFVDRLMNMK